MYQQTNVIGYVGGDPQMRYTAQGDPVASFSVAASRRWTDSNGQKQERTVWFKVSAWRRLAEVCNEYVKKGSLIFVQGELQEPRVWQDRGGEHRASLEITASAVQFLNRPGEGRDEPKAQEAETEEEIPFNPSPAGIR